MNTENPAIEEELSEQEREQMRKFAAFKTVTLVILLKWLWLLVLVFFVLSVVFSIHIVSHFANSVNRYKAVTKLLFTPRNTSKIQSINEKHLIGILDRYSLKRRVGTLMELPPAEMASLSTDLKIKQENKPNTFFTLTASSSSKQGAIDKVNEYAKVLIEEYELYRKNDLTKWSETLEQHKQALAEQIAELDAEEAITKGKTGVISPIETLTLMNGLISDQRRNVSAISVQIANEEVKKRRLEESIGKSGTAIHQSAPQIRKKHEELMAMDAELAKLRVIYTDINPKVQGKLNDYNALMDEYVGLLKSNGLEDIDLKDLEKMEQAIVDLAEVTQRIEVLTESKHSIEEEIKGNEAKCEVLTAVIPPLERINVKRAEIEKVMRELNEKLSDIDYLKTTASGDVHQIEMASNAIDNVPVNIKNLVLAIGGAFVCTLSLMFWIILLEFFYGKVRNSKELAAYDDILVLGSLPKPNILSKEKEKEVLDVVSLNFCNAELPTGIVLICRMPGARYLDNFFHELDWSLTMAGQRPFLLEIVPSIKFTPPEGSETLTNMIIKGARGWFPVVSIYALAPTETRMLKADLAELREEFDNVFILMPGGIRRGGNFFHQLLDLSESALLLVGANRTPRSGLKYVRTQATNANKEMMGLISGASIKEVCRDMELQHDNF